MTEIQEERRFNLTPSPRVLRMLGRIDFKPWQCLAELIDNSVDAFISAREGSLGSMFPQVNVELSSAADIRAKSGVLRVSDNGPGMSAENLEQALKAGFSTNNPVDKLGLFGMGFNVGTARLGSRTEVWTTRLEDDFWTGVRIDFDEMERSGTFVVPALSRRKTAAESQAHGTEVVISKLDVDRALYLRSGGGLRATRDRLSRVYNKIMREIGLQVVLIDTALIPREFCIWGRNRSVETKSELGRIPAYLEIDEDLGARLYCDDCWVWLVDGEKICPACQTDDRLRSRARRVTGWLGIQRFFDQVDYGIDLIRNGRVIEERSKSFFSWANPETGESTNEYPLEQTHWGGRIVGELSIDFVPLASHQKDAFEKNTSEWKLVEHVVRGDGPIVQVMRQRLGLPDREPSPLARLHQGYRRGQPAGLRWLVPGDPNGKGFNKPAVEWAQEFWAGNPEYKSDDRWWQAVLLTEEARTKKRGAPVPPDLAGDLEFASDGDDEVGADSDEDGARAPIHTPHDVVSPETESDTLLAGTYEIPEVPGSPRLDLEVRRLVRGRLPADLHFQFVAVGSRAEATYDPTHPMFTRSLTDPVDCLIQELAYQFLARSSTSQREWPISRITWLIRQKFFPSTLESYDVVFENAGAFLTDLMEHYAERLADIAPIDETLLPEDQWQLLRRQVSARDRAGEERVVEVVRTGEFPRYLGGPIAEWTLRRWPELGLDGEFLTVGYSDVAEHLRAEVLDRVTGPLRDVMWITNPDGAQVGGEEWRTQVARAGNGLRLLEAWRA